MCLSPLAFAYAAAVAMRGRAYDAGWLRTWRAPLRIISVGGLEAGGSGKTPVSCALLTELFDRGFRPGLLVRGYRRSTRGLVLRHARTAADPAALGDEAAMAVAALREAGHELVVAACADRIVGARALAAAGCDVAVMDDGFVHRRLHRDVDVVVLRDEAPLGDGRPLPSGSLREAPSALRRADVVWRYARPAVVGPSRPVFQAQLAEMAARGRTRAGPPHWVHSVATLAWPHAAPPLQGLAVLAAAGTARPAQLPEQLRAAGADVRAFVPFADHHPYTRADVRRLVALAQRTGAAAVVVTAKDEVKLARLWPTDAPALWAMGLRLQVPRNQLAWLEVLGPPGAAGAGVRQGRQM